MATGVKLKTRSDDPADLKAILEETHNAALIQNDFATSHWVKVRDEHLSLRSHLEILPDKLSQEVMVPIGSKALMRGKMVHTNEILVCLGDGWFVKRSAKQASEICERRIKLCESMLKDLERERDLLTNRKQIPLEQDAFGTESGNEILEPYDEEKEAQWRIEHQKKEREYRKKLGELRNKEKTVIDSEESLWKRLDDLELQEELEEELDRLHEERVERGYEDEESDEEIETEDFVEIEDGPNGLIKRNAPIPESSPPSLSSEKEKRSSRRVSFADERTPDPGSDCDSDSSAETLRIEFHHTPVQSERKHVKNPDEHQIQSPSDIPNYVKHLISKGGPPKSILKNRQEVPVCEDTGSQRMKWLDQPNSVSIINQEMEEPLSNSLEPQLANEEMVERPVVFGDILEHGSGEAPQLEEPEPAGRTSKFKARRMAAKR